MKIKKIAVLTSGGDCPGMNPAIFGVYTACQEHKIECIGVVGGFDGIIDCNFVNIDYDFCAGRINNGGTMLTSRRSPRFFKTSYIKKSVENLAANNIDALVVIGGDGSTRGAIALSKYGVKVICLPGTIDNDLNFAYTLGYNTAVNNIVNAVDNIIDCTASLSYGAVVKVMGRMCTDLIDSSASALYTKHVITSSDFDINKLVKEVKYEHNTKSLPPLVLVLEDVVDCTGLAKILEERCKFPWRAHILGYIQRGGKPCAFDRKYGYTAGIIAVKELVAGKSGYMVGMELDGLTKKPLEECLNH